MRKDWWVQQKMLRVGHGRSCFWSSDVPLLVLASLKQGSVSLDYEQGYKRNFTQCAFQWTSFDLFIIFNCHRAALFSVVTRNLISIVSIYWQWRSGEKWKVKKGGTGTTIDLKFQNKFWGPLVLKNQRKCHITQNIMYAFQNRWNILLNFNKHISRFNIYNC